MTKTTRPKKVHADHVFVQEAVYPTESLPRLARGDTVPYEECGWVLAPAGTVCRKEDFTPFIWKSLIGNGLVAPLSAEPPRPVQVQGVEQQTDESTAPLDVESGEG